MTVTIRLGQLEDVDQAVAVYVRSNLARRNGVWPNQAPRTAQVTRRLGEPDGWFLIAEDAANPVGMCAVVPLLADDGAGPPIPGGCFLSLMFVVPERWGQGIGGRLLDALLAAAARRGCREIRLWTDETDNERAHRLYRGRGLAPTGRKWTNEEGIAVGEWACELPTSPEPRGSQTRRGRTR